MVAPIDARAHVHTLAAARAPMARARPLLLFEDVVDDDDDDEQPARRGPRFFAERRRRRRWSPHGGDNVFLFSSVLLRSFASFRAAATAAYHFVSRRHGTEDEDVAARFFGRCFSSLVPLVWRSLPRPTELVFGGDLFVYPLFNSG